MGETTLQIKELIAHVMFIGEGVGLTLQLLLGGLALGVLFGTIFSVLRYNKILVLPIKSIVSILRGTPLILQLSFIYFSVPGILQFISDYFSITWLIGVKLSITSAGVIAFGLNSAAYISEIMRSGIENIPKGQFEAAKTLRISSFYMWKDIILPQVIRNVLPAMVSETIALLKETALISTIGGLDIMRSSQVLAAERFTFFMPLCIAGLYYYGMVLLIEYMGRKIEKKVAYAKH